VCRRHWQLPEPLFDKMAHTLGATTTGFCEDNLVYQQCVSNASQPKRQRRKCWRYFWSISSIFKENLPVLRTGGLQTMLIFHFRGYVNEQNKNLTH
jgi:hypothetical protein